MMAIFGGIIPRLILLAAWANDQAYWASTLFGGPLLFLVGFLFLPATTLVYGFSAVNGMSLLNWIFVGAALLIDLGTWGIGAFATRKEVSNYRGS